MMEDENLELTDEEMEVGYCWKDDFLVDPSMIQQEYDRLVGLL